MNISYFRVLCFGWALIGIVTRILMVALGDRWNRWEMEHAYASKRPSWIYAISVAGVGLVLFTWYKVIATDLAYSWIVAALLSLTLIKIGALLFNYERFRDFATTVLNNPQKRMQLNFSVFLMSLIFLGMGLALY